MLKRIEILLRTFLVLLISGKKKNRRIETIDKNKINKILIIRLNRIGDALVTTPLISLFKENMKCTIDILADKKNFFVFEGNKSIDNLIVFNKGLSGFRDFVKIDKKNRYDLIIDAHDDVSATVSFLIELSRAPYKLGLSKTNSSIFTTTVSRPDSAKVHVVERIASLGKALGIEPESSGLKIEYPVKKESIEFTEDFLDKNNLSEKFLIGINISAGSDARFWGLERFIKLIRFFKRFNAAIVLLTADKDLEKATAIGDQAEVPIFMSKNFNRFAAVISQLDFLFTPDTSAVHIASAYRIPLFGIYVKYNTDDIIWYPYNSEFEATVTTEPDFTNMTFESVRKKLEPFFITVYNRRGNS